MRDTTKMRLTLTAALSAATALSPAASFAQIEPASAPGATASPMVRIRQSSTADARATPLVLPLGKAAIVDLPDDARDVLLSNPSVADAVVRTARRVYVIGRTLGQTNAFFFDASGRQIANLEIRVEPDVAPLNDLLHDHLPNSHVVAEAVSGSIVLNGTASSPADADQAMQITQSYLGIAASSSAPTSGSSSTTPPSSGGRSGPQIINLIQVQGSEQVLVRVRVVEMSRTLIRQLGINLNYQEIANQLLPSDAFVDVATQEGFSVNGQLLGGLTGSGGIAHNILAPHSLTYPGSSVDPTVDPRASSNTGSAGVGGYQFDPTTGQETLGPADVQRDRRTEGSIQAFERAGLLHVLAEPNLTAISGEAARFLAGGEFPVPTRSDTSGQVQVEFKPFGVGLAITPLVLSGGRISLKLSTEVSELTSEGAVNTGDIPIHNQDGSTTVLHGITIPALQVRRAETTLEMSSGSSMVLAGLIQERSRHAYEGVPGVMNTPVIGQLFRSRDFINNETELVIIVTPYLVRPARPDQMHTPGDGYMDASDAESYLSGRLNAIYHPPHDDRDRPRELHGPQGHVIE